MELLFFIFILIIIFIGWKFFEKISSVTPSVDNNITTKSNDDFKSWLNVFKNKRSNMKEFDLFGTKAAIVWSDGDEEVVIICITAFQKQKPITNKWDYFEFNVEEKYWSGAAPKGSSARIREELKCLKLI